MDSQTFAMKTSSSVAAFVLRLPDHQKELHQFIWQLFDEQIHTDVTLALDDGQYIKAHKLILSAFSPYFKQVLTRISNPLQYPVIIVKDIVYEDLRSLIEFMYRGCTTVANERLPQVLKCAKQLKVRGLYETNNVENINEDDYDYNRNESKITETVQTISPTIMETIETTQQMCCNRKSKDKQNVFIDKNSNICHVKEELVNEWLNNKKLSSNPPKFLSPMALDLTKRIVQNNERTLIPISMSSSSSSTHPSFCRSISVDGCMTDKMVINVKEKRSPASLDGHLDSSKNEDFEPNCRKEKKRNLNIFHAAKYRNRKKQQLETLFGEENELMKKNTMAKVSIDKLESTILSLIWQQTKKSSNSKTVFICPVCGNSQTEVGRLRSHINMLHNDTEALMKFLMLQRSPSITSTTSKASSTSTSVPFHVNSN